MRRSAERTVLIVEPDADARAALRATLEGDGDTVIATTGDDDAPAIIDNPRIHLVEPDANVLKNTGAARLVEVAGTLGRTR